MKGSRESIRCSSKKTRTSPASNGGRFSLAVPFPCIPARAGGSFRNHVGLTTDTSRFDSFGTCIATGLTVDRRITPFIKI
jgi:hypothetical protein